MHPNKQQLSGCHPNSWKNGDLFHKNIFFTGQGRKVNPFGFRLLGGTKFCRWWCCMLSGYSLARKVEHQQWDKEVYDGKLAAVPNENLFISTRLQYDWTIRSWKQTEEKATNFEIILCSKNMY